MLGSLLLAAALFVGSHLALSHPFRAPLIERVGPGLFALAYSLVAAVTLVWLVLVWRGMPHVPPLWTVPEWGWAAAALVMLAASVLFAGSVVGNPALAQPGAEAMADGRPTGMLAITRHPMMWSFALWAAAHAAVWPTPDDLVLTGAVALLALGGAAGQDRRKDREMGASWTGWRAQTSFVPFAALADGRADGRAAWPGWAVLIAGVALWLAASWAHGPLAGRMVGVWR